MPYVSDNAGVVAGTVTTDDDPVTALLLPVIWHCR